MQKVSRSMIAWGAALLILMLGCREKQATVDKAKVAEVESEVAQEHQSTSAGYIGAAACSECHAEVAEQYQEHSMGRSLSTVRRLLEDASFIDGAPSVFEAGGFRYEVISENDKLIHRQSRVAAGGGELAVIEQEVQFAIGSGHHGRSYVVDHDGYLFLSPITWYPDKQIWDLSPGFETANSQFNRPVIETCLFCHSNSAPRMPHTANRYAQPVFNGHSIGCERCHGPGQQHVELHRDGDAAVADPDHGIVNPSRLEPALREAVCQQCHLSGIARVQKAGKSLYDFRPGQPLDSCFSTYVLRDDLVKDERLVGQVEQMYESRCFQQSNGKLGCISCHDPHQLPTAEDRIGYYRDRCLQCHQIDDCGVDEPARLAIDNQDSCMNCHMPRHETEVRHASVVDHRIPRRPGAPVGPVDGARNSWPLQHFPGVTENRTELDRDLAIAMLMAGPKHPEIMETGLLERIASTLERATRGAPDNYDAYEYLGEAYFRLGRAGAALKAYDHVLRRQPEREASLAMAGDILSSSREFRRAVDCWQRAIEVNPWMARYWYGLAQALAGSGQWQRCYDTAQIATGRFPTSIGARQLLIESALQLGRRNEAQETFEWLKSYNPRGMEALSQWYLGHPSRQ